MLSFSNSEGAVIVEDLVKAIREHKQYLSDIDGAIGDGDHGINMNKGFTMTAEALSDEPGDLSHSLKTLGTTLMNGIGGSMGPLYGMLFRRMAKACKGAEQIDAAVFAAMLTAAREGIGSISEAQVGDKTLVDTLFPAVDAYEKAVADGASFADALETMKAAAVRGRDSTKDMIAKLGRSSRLGERSRGTEDAGAASCCLILCTIADRAAALASQPAVA
ncbi:MAG: dihydroxyacetone kinase subunit L [Chitinivibrionales bacterium]|nr:dihydroxyacetone kinase subunit L [Chitinivibrionales bacterium]